MRRIGELDPGLVDQRRGAQRGAGIVATDGGGQAAQLFVGVAEQRVECRAVGDIARVVVTREVVLDNVLPTLVRREAPARAKRPRKESA